MLRQVFFPVYHHLIMKTRGEYLVLFSTKQEIKFLEEKKAEVQLIGIL